MLRWRFSRAGPAPSASSETSGRWRGASRLSSVPYRGSSGRCEAAPAGPGPRLPGTSFPDRGCVSDLPPRRNLAKLPRVSDRVPGGCSVRPGRRRYRLRVMERTRIRIESSFSSPFGQMNLSLLDTCLSRRNTRCQIKSMRGLARDRNHAIPEEVNPSDEVEATHFELFLLEQLGKNLGRKELYVPTFLKRVVMKLPLIEDGDREILQVPMVGRADNQMSFWFENCSRESRHLAWNV